MEGVYIRMYGDLKKPSGMLLVLMVIALSVRVMAVVFQSLI